MFMNKELSENLRLKCVTAHNENDNYKPIPMQFQVPITTVQNIKKSMNVLDICKIPKYKEGNPRYHYVGRKVLGAV